MHVYGCSQLPLQRDRLIYLGTFVAFGGRRGPPSELYVRTWVVYVTGQERTACLIIPTVCWSRSVTPDKESPLTTPTVSFNIAAAATICL